MNLDYFGDDEDNDLASMAASTIHGINPDAESAPANMFASTPQQLFTPNEVAGGSRMAASAGTPIGMPHSTTSVPDLYSAFGLGKSKEPSWKRELSDALSVALPAAAGGIMGWKTGEGYGPGSMRALQKSYPATMAVREKEKQTMEAQKMKLLTNPNLLGAYSRAKKTAESGMFDQSKTFNDLLNEELTKVKSDQTPFQKDFEYYLTQTPDNQKKMLEYKAANKLTLGPMDIPNYNLRVQKAQRHAEENKRRMDEQHEQFINKQIERLQGKLGNAQDLTNTLGEAESIIAKSTGNPGFKVEDYNPDTGMVGDKKINLPGVSIPGIGRISFYSSDARDLASTLGRLFNIELKSRSGVAVTIPELERLKVEFAQGKFNNEHEMIKALQRYKRALFNGMQNIESGFTPEAVQTNEQRGGATSRALKIRQNLPDQIPFSPDEIDAAIQRKVNNAK